MARLPVCSEALKAFGRIGYVLNHQTESHTLLRNASGRRLRVLNHRNLAKGNLRALILQAGLTGEQFVDLL